MGDPAIHVENLGKKYRIGEGQASAFQYRALRDVLAEALHSPLRRISPVFRSSRGREAGKDSESFIWALREVSFDVEHGEVVGVIGRNGAGKTTLLKVLSRITEPTEGGVDLYGRVGSLLEVGTGFHPELTGRENVYLNGAILGMTRAEIARKFDEIVAFAEIEKFLDTPVKRYSSGMYVRLAFAVAAHLEPEILLVDEVLAVGDVQFQKKCLGKMSDVARAGRTVLFVSHNMVAVEGLCTRGIVLSQGRLVYDGSAQGAVSFYLEDAQSLSLIPLGERQDREGDGRVRAVELTIRDASGRPTQSINMGDSFTVELRTVGKLNKAIIGILVGNAYRQQMIRGYTWENLAEDVELVGEDTVRCHFERFPMMHGSYNVHVWIGQRLGARQELVDYVENAASLRVQPVDIYDNGRILDPGGGVAFCRVSWEIEPAVASRVAPGLGSTRKPDTMSAG